MTSKMNHSPEGSKGSPGERKGSPGGFDEDQTQFQETPARLRTMRGDNIPPWTKDERDELRRFVETRAGGRPGEDDIEAWTEMSLRLGSGRDPMAVMRQYNVLVPSGRGMTRGEELLPITTKKRKGPPKAKATSPQAKVAAPSKAPLTHKAPQKEAKKGPAKEVTPASSSSSSFEFPAPVGLMRRDSTSISRSESEDPPATTALLPKKSKVTLSRTVQDLSEEISCQLQHHTRVTSTFDTKLASIDLRVATMDNRLEKLVETTSKMAAALETLALKADGSPKPSSAG